MSSEPRDMQPRVTDPLINTDPPERFSEYAQRVIDSHVIDPETGEQQPDHWAKRVFVSSGRGYGKTLLLNRLRRYQ